MTFYVYYNYQQDNWFELLPLAKFAYNNALSAITSVSLFFANKGYHPNITVHSEHLITASNINKYSKYINTKYRFICDHNESGHILTLYIPTDQQPVDGFTKSLSLVKFSIFVSGLDCNSIVCYKTNSRVRVRTE